MPRRPGLARRAQLAQAAFEMLRARGMQISMCELADALGIKRPTLYFYFPDLGAVIERARAVRARAVARAAQTRAEPTMTRRDPDLGAGAASTPSAHLMRVDAY